MRSSRASLTLSIALGVLGWPAAHGQTPYTPPKQADNPYPYSPLEPKAKAFSLAKSAAYLDGVAAFWMRPNSCGACHANFAYLMARPLLGDSPLVAETRQFLERRKPAKPLVFSFDAESVGIAFALAWDDARTGGKLRPASRQALRRMWSFQRPQGMWCKMGCGQTLPPENDFHYTAVLAAVGASVAPEGYARTAEAQDGLTRLRRYFAQPSARTPHDEALLLWTSLHVDGLMTTSEREAAVRHLLSRQRQDGGWSFAAMSEKPRAPAPPDAPSDGYGTALTVYVLRQAGVAADRPEIVRGVAWLRGNQRASGCWFTPSRAAGNPTEGGVGTRDLYVQNLGTAFAVLALRACEGSDGDLAPVSPRPLLRRSGLSVRERLVPD